MFSFIYPGARVGVVGSRDYPYPELVKSFIDKLPADVLVCSGCSGRRSSGKFWGGGIVDCTALDEAVSRGLLVSWFAADWRRYGRGAGPVRNREMVNSGLYCLVVFLNLEVASDGSRDAIKAAKAAGVPVFVFDQKGNPIIIEDKKQLKIF